MDNTEKFTHKVEAYKRYRPGYPDAFLSYLFNEVGFSGDACVADIGAGTGILTEALADRVKTVYAIEPNRNMRLACMETCGNSCGFVALEGTAENTGLPDQCVDFITAAQAFHWFEPHRTYQEFSRVLKPDGLLVLVWNSREPDSALTREWASVMAAHCKAFKGFSGGTTFSDARILDFFRDGICETRTFENHRALDLPAFLGTSLSASYAPLPESDAHQAFLRDLTSLFEAHAHEDVLHVPMHTHSYVGRI